MTGYEWPDIASAAARRVADDLGVIAELLDACAGLPGDADSFVDMDAQLGFYFARFDQGDDSLRAGLGLLPAPHKSGSPHLCVGRVMVSPLQQR
jgi:hypothetical protein